jgi:hypothetical protein
LYHALSRQKTIFVLPDTFASQRIQNRSDAIQWVELDAGNSASKNERQSHSERLRAPKEAERDES